ncbi:MAG: DUF4390 domain-containing protein [Gammaproteobacteria bacterium]|nr:DUF4390 domain-containing protein [Gammaproteobacteria bacterium]
MRYCANSNHKPTTVRQWYLFFCLLLFIPSVFADGIFIRKADSTLVAGIYRLDAQIDYRLPSELQEALRNGVTLTLMVEVEVLSPRNYWFDESVTSLTQHYQLSFHALSQKYQLIKSSGQPSIHDNLQSALQALGKLNDIPMFESDLLQAHENYFGRIQAKLDVAKLPMPLLLLSYVVPAWQLHSEWYTWPIQD